ACSQDRQGSTGEGGQRRRSVTADFDEAPVVQAGAFRNVIKTGRHHHALAVSAPAGECAPLHPRPWACAWFSTAVTRRSVRAAAIWLPKAASLASIRRTYRLVLRLT